MTQSKQVLLGLCPIGKFVFSHEDAIRQKRALQAKLKEWGVEFVDLDGVLKDGIVRDQAHVDIAVERFRSAGVAGIVMPHCNFGTEGAVGMIGKKLGLPVLLWGPRDEAPEPDGTRLRDTLCGLFASSKVLHKLAVPFTYVENCRIDAPPLRRGLDTFLRAANVASAMRRGLRIGHIGQRIDFFWTTIVNESELLERFGVQVLPLEMITFIEGARDRAAKGQALYAREAAELRKTCNIVGYDSDQPLMNVLAVRDQMLALVDEHGLDGLAIQDFMSIVNAMGTWCSFAESFVSDRVPLGLESDIHGALSSILLHKAMLGRQAVNPAEFAVRHPTDDNAVLLWHCGAPISMLHPDERIRLDQHWILPGPLAGMTHFRLKDGPITVTRFDGDRGHYQLAVGQGQSTSGPETENNYVWMKVDDWPHWERTVMQGPFIHHVAMGYEHVGDALVEACKFIPGLEPIRLDR